MCFITLHVTDLLFIGIVFLSSIVFCAFYFVFYNLQHLFMLLFQNLHVRLIYAIIHLFIYFLFIYLLTYLLTLSYGTISYESGHGTPQADSGMIPAKPGWMTALHMSKKQKHLQT